MFRIGTVNIDTSHAPSFAGILLKGDKARYTAIYNDGFRTDADVEKFMQTYGLTARYDSLADMARHIDIAFIQSCDWDRHVELSAPFVEAGVPVFIDKPIAGNLKDLKTIEKWGEEGKIILGSSAMRYTYEHDDFFKNARAEDILSVTATVGVDEFNYAIHAVEEILGFLRDQNPVSTQFIGENTVDGVRTDSYRVLFENGASAYYHICNKGWQPSTATVLCKKTTYVYKIDSGKVYEAMLNRVWDYFNGETQALASVKSMCDAVRVMLAGRVSRLGKGGAVFLKDLSENDGGFDGLSFYNTYKKQNGY